jgi:hypothetical protein
MPVSKDDNVGEKGNAATSHSSLAHNRKVFTTWELCKISANRKHDQSRSGYLL